MRRTSIALTSLAVALLGAEARARPIHPALAVQALGNRTAVTAAPFQPIGSPTAWVTAKDLANITLTQPGSGNYVISCVNKGTAGGAFHNLDYPNNRPRWYDDAFLGAGRPYLWFPGQSEVRSLWGSLPSVAYITPTDCTIYVVMYAHSLESDGSGVNNNPTPIEFDNIGLSVRSGAGGQAIAWHQTTGNPIDNIEAPITNGDATLHVWKVVHDNDVLSLSVDGGIPVSTPCSGIYTPNGPPNIGFNGQSFNNGMFHGAICEWIVYNRALTPSEDKSNMAYLRKQWGTP